MIRWLLGLVWCLHDHYRRERDDTGALWLVCDRCDRRVPALARTAKELRTMRREFPAIVARRARSSAKVVAMKGRR